MRISDRLTLLFPRTAYGILNEGEWRDIENEAPKPPKKPLGLRTGYTPVKSSEAKEVESGGGSRSPRKKDKTTAENSLRSEMRSAVSEFLDEEALANYETQRIIYHEELKMYVRDKKDYHLEVIKMHAIFHEMLSPEAAEKIEKTENYETEIAKPRNGEKLCDCIRKVLVVGIVGPSHEVNRRAAEKRWESVCQGKEPEETLTNYKERFNDQYGKFVGAGGTKLEQTDLARRFMWTLDVDRYAEAISSILNDESSERPMPETVEAMCERIRKHVSLKPSIKNPKEKFGESDTARMVFAMTSDKSGARKSSSDSDSDSDKKRIRKKDKKLRGKSDKDTDTSVSGNRNIEGRTFGACHECGEEGHYAADCELRKTLNKVKAGYKKKQAGTGTVRDAEFMKCVKECVEDLARERERSKSIPKSYSMDHKLAAFTWANDPPHIDEDTSPFM